MKKRLVKKLAKQYLAGKLYVPTREDHWCIDTDGNEVYVTIAILHPKVEKMVLHLARRMGWTGCWWDNPTYLSIHVNSL